MDQQTRAALAALTIDAETRCDALRNALVQCGSCRVQINTLLADRRTKRLLDHLAERHWDLHQQITREIDEALSAAARPADPADWPD